MEDAGELEACVGKEATDCLALQPLQMLRKAANHLSSTKELQAAGMGKNTSAERASS
jgi:hypothetical protein